VGRLCKCSGLLFSSYGNKKKIAFPLSGLVSAGELNALYDVEIKRWPCVEPVSYGHFLALIRVPLCHFGVNCFDVI
jgi:hypothetical protein